MGKKKNKGGGGGGGGGGNGGGGGGGDGGKGGGGGGGDGGGDYLNVVLKVDLHCDGCTKRIRKCALSYPGVLKVDFEGGNTMKIVARKDLDASEMTKIFEKKLLKDVQLISPKPPKKDDQKKDNNIQDKPKELPMTTVILKIHYHCFGCGEKIYKAVSNYKGVIEVMIDKEKDLWTVKGKVDGKQLMEEMKKKLKKAVEIVPEKKKDNNKDGNAEKKQENPGGGGGDGEKGGEKVVNVNYYTMVPYEYAYGYGYGYGYAPQLFSDENPNACSIM